MRNYSEATVVATKVFGADSYEVALQWARTEQKNAPVNISYTIDRDGAKGIVTKHEGFNGGVPPYQPIVHNSSTDTNDVA